MRKRIAHRPRYRTMHSLPPSPPRSRKNFLRNRWTYRPTTILYQKRTIGQGLSLIPFGYRLLRGLSLR